MSVHPDIMEVATGVVSRKSGHEQGLWQILSQGKLW